MKTKYLLPLLLFVATFALTAYILQLQSALRLAQQESAGNIRRITMLQVQLMDRFISQQQVQEVDKLLTNPDEWLAPLRDRINADPKLAALLKEVGFRSMVQPNGDIIEICCNPVDDSPEPYEVFTLTFSGDRCISISRRAACPW